MFKSSYVLALTLFIPLLFLSCNKEEVDPYEKRQRDLEKLYKKNQSKISVEQGVAGTLIMKEGNCMPMIGPYEGDNPCRSFPVERTIQIYEPTSDSEVESNGPGPTYEEVHTKLIAETNSDEEGFFQLQLDSGQYSLFIIEKGKYYRNMWKDNLIGPFTVEADSVTIENPVIDYAVY